MSASGYDKALKFTLKWEGGYVNDPDDPGGATNKGITQGTYDAYRKSKGLPKVAVKGITDVEVKDIYRNRYWKAVGGDQLPTPADIALFDTGVNMGVGTAKKMLLVARESMDTDPNNDGIELARRIIDLRVNRYYAIVKAKPKMQKFLQGWLNRARALKKEVGY